jgi:hypothetical protein
MDKVVMAFYTGQGQEVRSDPLIICGVIRSWSRFGSQQQMAQQVLTQFQEHPDAWTRVPDILERSAFPQAKVRSSSLQDHVLGLADRVGSSILVCRSLKSWSLHGGSPYLMVNGKVGDLFCDLDQRWLGGLWQAFGTS